MAGLQVHARRGAVLAALAAAFSGAFRAALAQAPAPQFTVFFDWESTQISSQGQAVVRSAAKAFLDGQASRRFSKITVTGHTDASHAGNYNMILSMKRAGAVKDALIALGVPRTAVALIGLGKNKPVVQTADGVREQQNRRAEILLQ